EQIITTACGQCASGFSIKARVVEGRLVKLEGNPDCPISRGGIGPRGLAGTQVLYDPDRIRQPLLRTGGRGAPTFKEITWDEALDILTARLKTLRDKNETHRAGLVVGRERGLMLQLFQRFAVAFGTPNLFDGWSHGNAAIAQAFELMTGNRELPAHDWQTVQYILSIDSSLLETACQPINFAHPQAPSRKGPVPLRARFVHAGQALTRTGINADEVLQINPGSGAALALGLCRVLVKDELYDKAYVAERCHGFETWKDDAGVEHPGLKDALETYTPAFVADQCGITEKTLLRIAHEFAEARPAFAITGPAATLAPNGLSVAWAVQTLNALAGMINRPGGVLVQLDPPLLPWDKFQPDAIAQAGLKQPRLDGAGQTAFPLASTAIEALPEALLSGQPYSLDTLLLYYSNPLYSKLNPARWKAALAKVPFIVSFSPFLDETVSELADLVLPDNTYLERWEDAAPAPNTGYPIFSIRQPVVDTILTTRPTGDVLLAIAKKLGGDTATALPWKDFKDALLKRLVGIYKAKRGSIVADSGGKFLAKLYEVGVWIDPTYPYGDWQVLIKTPSGKIELYAQTLAKQLTDFAAATNRSIEKVLADCHLPADLDHACLPHADPPGWQGDAKGFPLLLLPYKPNTYAEGSGANLPLLQELPLYKGRRRWTTEAELHPTTAAEHGITSTDRMDIESPAALITVDVFITAGIQPGVVRVPQGGGHTAFGRWAKGRGANVMNLLQHAAIHPLSGVSPVVGTRVRIRKASV
ncbi:MAG TPA: molybdopterin-dependent oxidoreductase, partial [Planctomycetota bacterium]|nr:molybdopterin-dependent oxidoreductase [Planctomycetota bacterium]